MSAWAAYADARIAATAAPVKLSEMVDVIDEVASEFAATQRALLLPNLRTTPAPSHMRRIVVLERTLEALHALERDPDLAKRLSRLMSENRKEWGSTG